VREMKSEDKKVCRFCNNELWFVSNIGFGEAWACYKCKSNNSEMPALEYVYCQSLSGIYLDRYSIHIRDSLYWMFYIDKPYIKMPCSEITEETPLISKSIVKFDCPLDITPDNVEEKAKLYMLFS
jgi:hypothetical protein